MAGNEVEIRITGDAAGAKRAFEGATKGLKGLRDGINRTGARFREMGTQLGMAIAPMAGLGFVAVRAFAGFEQSMARVKAVSGATQTQFTSLTRLARDMGKTTQFSASQAAEALTFLAMAGMSAEEQTAALPRVLELAAAGALELGTAADIVTNVMAGFELGTDELAKANDVLTTAFTSANTDLIQLGQAFKFAGPVAKAAGLSFEETTASLALLGNAGIQASMAGTGLRAAISKLLNPTEEAANILARLGVVAIDSTGAMLPMVDIVGDLEKAGLTASDAMVIFGLRAGPAMLALVSQGSDALTELTEKMTESGGVAGEIARIQMDTLQGQFLRIKSAIESLLISLGEKLMPTIMAFGDRLLPVIDRLIQFAENNQTLITVMAAGVVAVAGISAALVGLGIVLPALGAGLSAIIGAFTVLRVLMSGPAGIALLAASLAAGAAAVVGVKRIMGFEHGGQVPEDMIAQVHKGEWIIPEGMARKSGLDLLPSNPLDLLSALTRQANVLPDTQDFRDFNLVAIGITGVNDALKNYLTTQNEAVKIAPRHVIETNKLEVANVTVAKALKATGIQAAFTSDALDSMNASIDRLIEGSKASGDEIKNVEVALLRIAEGAAPGFSDAFLNSLTAINIAGAGFGESMEHFASLGFKVGEAYDLAAIKVGKEFADGLQQIFGQMEGGNVLLEGMTQGVITNQAAVNAIIAEYGSWEAALKTTGEQAAALTDELEAQAAAAARAAVASARAAAAARTAAVGLDFAVRRGTVGAGGPVSTTPIGLPSLMGPRGLDETEKQFEVRRAILPRMVSNAASIIDRNARSVALYGLIGSFGSTIRNIMEEQGVSFAHGGIVTRPTLAMIGEAGPEAVVPLSGGRGMAPVYNITISDNTVFGEMDFRRLVVDAVTDSHRRGGLPFLGRA